jgi:hypothetical protein
VVHSSYLIEIITSLVCDLNVLPISLHVNLRGDRAKFAPHAPERAKDTKLLCIQLVARYKIANKVHKM